jgi:hypothetical protein
MNDIEDNLGDSSEDPFDDAGVNLVPLTVMLLRRGW